MSSRASSILAGSILRRGLRITSSYSASTAEKRTSEFFGWWQVKNRGGRTFVDQVGGHHDVGVNDDLDHLPARLVVFFLSCRRRTAATSRSIWAMVSLSVPLRLASSRIACRAGGVGATCLMNSFMSMTTCGCR